MSAALDPFGAPLESQLVQASAGTGKTWTITALYLRMVLELELDVRDILVITFTRAATGEVRHRIRERLRDALRETTGQASGDGFAHDLIQRRERQSHDAQLLVRALSAIDEAPVSTIHSFCQRILAEHAFELGAPLSFAPAAAGSAWEESFAHERWLRAMAAPSEPVRAALEGIPVTTLTSVATAATRWPNHPVEPRPAQPFTRACGATDAVWARATALIARLGKAPAALEKFLRKQPLKDSAWNDAQLPKRLAHLEQWLAADLATQLADGKTPGWVTRDSIESRWLRANATLGDHAVLGLLDDLTALQTDWAAATTAVEHALLHETAEEARRVVPEIRARRGEVTFDELLTRVRDRLEAKDGDEVARRLSKKWPAALVDEFQDTDPVQWSILRRIFGQSRLILVGDPKQAIYGFRGADIHAYLGAAEQFSQATLGQSQRSDKPLVEALNVWFGAVSEPFRHPRIQYAQMLARHGVRLRGQGVVPLQLHVLSEPQRAYTSGEAQEVIPRLVAREVAGLLERKWMVDERPVMPRDVAVLVRTNDQALAVQRALRAAQVPAVLATESSVLATAEAEELSEVLSALLDPRSTRRVRAALTTTLLGYSANALDAADETAMEREVARLHGMAGTWREHGFYRAFRLLIAEHGVPARLLAGPDGERRLANLLHLGEILHERARATGHGPEALVAWFDHQRATLEAPDPDDVEDAIAPETMQMRLESDDDAVRIATIHKSKGLEYPIVFAPYLWQSNTHERDERLVPIPATAGLPARLWMRQVGADDDPPLTAAREDERAEHMRLAYVALTRARHQLHVVVPNVKKGFDASPLAHLLQVEGKMPAAVKADPTAPQRRHALLTGAVDALVQRGEKRIASRVESADSVRAARPRYTRVRTTQLRDVSAAPRPELRYDGFRTSSFTTITAEHERPSPLLAATHEEEVAQTKDHDDASPDDALHDVVVDEAPVRLTSYPRGREAGTALHELFEQLDFTTATPDDVREVFTSLPARVRLNAAQLDDLAAGVMAALDTRLPAPKPFALRDVAPSRCLREVDFLLPVVDEPGRRAIGRRKLLEVLKTHAHTPLERAYAEHAAESLEFASWAGWLKGSVDLFFEHDGRYYVLDWKSNFLGPLPSHYRRAALDAEMVKKQYVLQAHFYSVAMHRHLQARLPGYSFTRHFGGSIYLFVRGCSPETGDHGVVFEPPNEALVTALSDLFAKGGA